MLSESFKNTEENSSNTQNIVTIEIAIFLHVIWKNVQKLDLKFDAGDYNFFTYKIKFLDILKWRHVRREYGSIV